MNQFRHPNSSDDLCLPFCLYDFILLLCLAYSVLFLALLQKARWENILFLQHALCSFYWGHVAHVPRVHCPCSSAYTMSCCPKDMSFFAASWKSSLYIIYTVYNVHTSCILCTKEYRRQGTPPSPLILGPSALESRNRNDSSLSVEWCTTVYVV